MLSSLVSQSAETSRRQRFNNLCDPMALTKWSCMDIQ